jgi:hypothetical protein
MDIALALESLVAGAIYSGSLTANTQEAYESITWNDARTKPTWAELEVAWLGVCRDNKLIELAAYRYEKETSGITTGNGVSIKTDRESQGLFHRTWTEAQVNADISIKWKGVNAWIQIGKTEIDAIKQVMFGYVEACFNTEAAHAEAIGALTTSAEIEAYDITTGWPV